MAFLTPAWQRLFLVALCLLLAGIWWSVPITELDEALYGEVAREMVVSHQYLIPHQNYQPFYEKPVLVYWMQAASFRMFGINAVALRLPSAVCSLLLVLLLHAFLLRWLAWPHSDPYAWARANACAFLGGVAAALLPAVALWARVATMDAPVTLFMTATILALLHADLLRRETESLSPPRATGWYLLAALTAGLAFLTKGPVGVVVPGLIWLVYHLRQGDVWAELRRVPWLAAVPLFLVVAIPWYLATLLVDGPQFLRTFFLNENLARFASVSREGHGFGVSLFGRLIGLVFYPLISVLLLFPCSPLLIREARMPFAGNEAFQRDPVLSSLRRFAWVWIITVIALFSFSRTQLPNYILVIAGGAVILFSVHLLARFSTHETPGENRSEATVFSLVGLLFTAVSICGLVIPQVRMGPLGTLPLPYPSAQVVLVLVIITGLLFQVGIWWHRRHSARLIAWGLAGWTAIFILLLSCGVLVLRSYYTPVVQVGKYLRGRPADEQVIVYLEDQNPYSLVFYARRAVAFYSAPDQLRIPLYNAHAADTLGQEVTALRASGHSATIVTNEREMPAIYALAPTVQCLRHFGETVVLRIAAR